MVYECQRNYYLECVHILSAASKLGYGIHGPEKPGLTGYVDLASSGFHLFSPGQVTGAAEDGLEAQFLPQRWLMMRLLAELSG